MISAKPNVLVQGITGTAGTYWTEHMLASGTSVVAGCTPGRGGQEVLGVPVYNTVSDALEAHQIDVSAVFVAAAFAKDAAVEAIRAGVPVVIVVADSIPVHDTMEILSLAQRAEARLIGPGSPGVVFPGGDFVGTRPDPPNGVFGPGRIGVVSRNGGLAARINADLVEAGYGQSAFIGLGADVIVGTTFVDALEWFESDPATDAVVMLCETGGPMEEEAATFIPTMTKPVVAFVADHDPAEDKPLGHAGTMFSSAPSTAASKREVLAAAGAHVSTSSSDVITLLRSTI